MGNCINDTKSESQIKELQPEGSVPISGEERKLLYQIYESLISRSNKDLHIGFETFAKFCPIKGYWCDLIYTYMDKLGPI